MSVGCGAATLTDMLNVCPRCTGFIPTNNAPGQYPGALSRFDNETEVCSDCGTEEAIVALVPVIMWPVTVLEGAEYDQARHRRAERLIRYL